MQKDCSTCRFENSYLALFHCFSCASADSWAFDTGGIRYDFWKAKRNARFIRGVIESVDWKKRVQTRGIVGSEEKVQKSEDTGTEARK